MALAAIGTATLVVTIVVWAMQTHGTITTGEWARILVPGLPGILLAAPAVLTGLTIGVPRFHLYALLFVIAGAVGVLLELEPGFYMAVAGTVVLFAGLVLVTQFVRRCPVPDEVAR